MTLHSNALHTDGYFVARSTTSNQEPLKGVGAMSARIAIVLFMGLLVLSLACGDDNPAEPPQAGWYALGLGESRILDLEHAWPYLYAGTSGNGLFRTAVTRSDPSWEYLGFAEEWCHDVKVLEDGAILVAASSGLYRSENNGHTWVRSDGEYGLDVTCLTSCCDTVLAGTSFRGLYRSVDNGRSWSHIDHTGLTDQYQLECHPADCSFMLTTIISLRGEDLLLISHDGGATWGPRMSSALHYYQGPRGIAVDPMDENVAYVGTHGAILKTVDRGESWTPILEPAEEPWFKVVIHDPGRRHRVYGAGFGYIYMTEDDGETMERVQIPVDEEVTDLACDARHRALYVGTPVGVYKHVY